MSQKTANDLNMWAEEDKPAYKIEKFEKNTTNVELLSTLCTNGVRNPVTTARGLLHDCENSLFVLSRKSIAELKVLGLTDTEAIRIKAMTELCIRFQSEASINPMDQIKNSEGAYNELRHIGYLGHEEFHVILLTRAHRIIKTVKISQGGLTGTVIDVRLILHEAITHKACAIIIAHNHPSGSDKPSETDISITKKIKESAEIMDINLLDHIIVTQTSYYSLADNGVIQ